MIEILGPQQMTVIVDMCVPHVLKVAIERSRR